MDSGRKRTAGPAKGSLASLGHQTIPKPMSIGGGVELAHIYVRGAAQGQEVINRFQQ